MISTLVNLSDIRSSLILHTKCNSYYYYSLYESSVIDMMETVYNGIKTLRCALDGVWHDHFNS